MNSCARILAGAAALVCLPALSSAGELTYTRSARGVDSLGAFVAADAGEARLLGILDVHDDWAFAEARAASPWWHGLAVEAEINGFAEVAGLPRAYRAGIVRRLSLPRGGALDFRALLLGDKQVSAELYQPLGRGWTAIGWLDRDIGEGGRFVGEATIRRALTRHVFVFARLRAHGYRPRHRGLAFGIGVSQ